MVNTCGSGLAPPKGMVKSRGFTWLKTLGPTDTLTGTVTLQPVVLNKIWPTQVPAVTPPPGSDAGASPTETGEGAVPDVALSVSQLPPSAVVAVAVQCNLAKDVGSHRHSHWHGDAAARGFEQDLADPGSRGDTAGTWV